jgi:DNA polymerase-1
MKQRLLLIDTSALFHRSRSALLRSCGELTTSAGIPITGTMSFLNGMFAVMDKYDYDCVIPCAEGGNNWRKKESGDYKSNRTSGDIAHYADQSLLLDEVLPTLGMNVVKAPGYEADDAIAHISRYSPAYEEIHILSCDKDLLQLVTNRVKVLLFSSTKKTELVDIDGVIRHFGVFPAEVKYFKALAGDSSDNVAGIKGVGKKTAIKIIEESRPSEVNPEFTGADRICLHPKVKDQAGTFLANLRLVTLENDVPELTWFASSPPFPVHVEAMLEGLEFKQMLKRKQKIFETLKCQNTILESSSFSGGD